MSKKRFEYYNYKGADYILDTPNKNLDFIEMLDDCLETEEIVDLLNDLNDENEQLKFENESFKSRITSLNELIKEFGNKENKVNNEKYKCHICKHLHSDKTLKLYCDINGGNFLKKYYDCKNFEDYKDFK